mmetsp:Transcript_1546/g.1862  ORF Transcript_1546/g.1862 Transcript_1546/m.1862 type:complete len:252 (-) Transcript_1546:119-874(-)|eukprot:CAMPEP_0194148862 /NCGR_PEP_ID=MMETSP0152-20130528/34979_1 /TAXON_ID=1049557 /ORGANISM="Thalassiothrix antarctica, Strain L6-D1" /LENGTH=251 /DNA_ID=CAMNT_0038850677 /DNA_START=83 /DNA_END=838 /DNA_ORIENTATION=-
MKVLYDQSGVSLLREVDDDGDNSIYTIVLDGGQNLVNDELNSILNEVLDLLEKEQQSNKALIITGKGKFFSNGLDLKVLMSSEEGGNRMIEGFWKVMARILVMDCRTVAAINGHAFGAGLFLALCCDYRVMRTERGYLNWPELNLGLNLAKGFAEITKAKVTNPRVLREGVLTGKRYTSQDALKDNIIDMKCPIEDLMIRAKEIAMAGLPSSLKLRSFNPESFREMKIELYTDAYRSLTMAKRATPPISKL